MLVVIGKTILEKQQTRSSDGDINKFLDDTNIELPIKSIEDLNSFETSLNKKEFKIMFIKKLSLIGAVHSKMLAIRIIDAVLSKYVLNNVCWKGNVHQF